jgi:hypothetical protein
MRFRHTLLLAALSLLPLRASSQQGQNLCKPTADQLSSEIARLSLRRVYVSDFLDASGQRTPTGAYFAAAFSKLLRQPPHDFTIISRFNAHKFLDDSGWTDRDLSNPGVLAKFTSAFNPDAFLSGTVVPDNRSVSIDLVLTDLAGKELFRVPYLSTLRWIELLWKSSGTGALIRPKIRTAIWSRSAFCWKFPSGSVSFGPPLPSLVV